VSGDRPKVKAVPCDRDKFARIVKVDTSGLTATWSEGRWVIRGRIVVRYRNEYDGQHKGAEKVDGTGVWGAEDFADYHGFVLRVEG